MREKEKATILCFNFFQNNIVLEKKREIKWKAGRKPSQALYSVVLFTAPCSPYTSAVINYFQNSSCSVRTPCSFPTTGKKNPRTHPLKQSKGNERLPLSFSLFLSFFLYLSFLSPSLNSLTQHGGIF